MGVGQIHWRVKRAGGWDLSITGLFIVAHGCVCPRELFEGLVGFP